MLTVAQAMPQSLEFFMQPSGCSIFTASLAHRDAHDFFYVELTIHIPYFVSVELIQHNLVCLGLPGNGGREKTEIGAHPQN